MRQNFTLPMQVPYLAADLRSVFILMNHCVDGVEQHWRHIQCNSLIFHKERPFWLLKCTFVEGLQQPQCFCCFLVIQRCAVVLNKWLLFIWTLFKIFGHLICFLDFFRLFHIFLQIKNYLFLKKWNRCFYTKNDNSLSAFPQNLMLFIFLWKLWLNAHNSIIIPMSTNHLPPN